MYWKTYKVVFSTELVVTFMYTWEGYAGNHNNLFISGILRDYTRSSVILFVMDEDIVR